MEDDDLVNPVDEFGAEMAADDLQYRGLHPVVARSAAGFRGHFLDHARAEVGGHDDDGVAEIDRPPLAVGQAAVVQHLQQDVEHVRMRLLDLVEQDDTVRPATDRLRQVAALLVADIARRRTDQACHRMLFHELRHVDADHGLVGIEQEFGQRLGQLGLAHPGRTEEEEGAVRPVRVAQARARAADGIGDRAHRLGLTDDPMAERRFHRQQLFPLALQHLGDRDAGPLGDDLGDFFLGHPAADQGMSATVFGVLRRAQPLFELRDPSVLQLRHAREIGGTPRGLELLPGTLERFLDVRGALQLRLLCAPHLDQVGVLALEFLQRPVELLAPLLRGVVRFLLDRLALHLQLDDPPVQAVERFGLGVDFHADARAGLVDQVDGLVRQLPVGYVAVRQRGCRDDRRVGDLDLVMHLVALLQAAQDRYRVLDRRLVDQHLLETTLERRVLLDVLAVLVERGGAHAVQLAAGERRLEHVAGIHRPVGLAGTDHRVQLIDEEDDLPFLLGEFVEDAFHALLEVAPIFRSGNERAHVEGQDALAAQSFRHLAIDDAKRQALDDGGLADAGLADQHRVVLGAPLQDLDSAPDLVITTDDGVEFARFGTGGQVDGVLVQRAARLLGIRVGDLFAGAHFIDRLVGRGARGAAVLQRLRELALALERGEHEELGGYVTVAAVLSEAIGQVQQPRKVVGDVHLARLRTLHRRLTVEHLAEPGPQLGHVGAGLVEQRPDGAALLVDQRQHQVRGFDELVVAADRDRLCIRERGLELGRQLVLSHGVATRRCLWSILGAKPQISTRNTRIRRAPARARAGARARPIVRPARAASPSAPSAARADANTSGRHRRRYRGHRHRRCAPQGVPGGAGRAPRGPPGTGRGHWRQNTAQRQDRLPERPHGPPCRPRTRPVRSPAPATPEPPPERPAWATPSTAPSRLANATGRQSAVRIARTAARSRVTAASAGGGGADTPPGPGWTATSLPCTWVSQNGGAGRPSASPSAVRLAATRSGSSPTWVARLRPASGPRLIPPERVVTPARTPAGAGQSASSQPMAVMAGGRGAPSARGSGPQSRPAAAPRR